MDETTQPGHYRIVGQLGAGGMGRCIAASVPVGQRLNDLPP